MVVLERLSIKVKPVDIELLWISKKLNIRDGNLL